MGKVKNQHYIPQSYMRGFAFSQKKEWYVFTKINQESIFPINIKNICTERYLYDVPELGNEKEQLIEKFYASNVDGNFPEILEFAKDDNNLNLTTDMRAKIILSCVTLVFRTPKFLNSDADQIIIHADMDKNNIDAERAKKILALHNHFQKSINLIKQKQNDGIAINKAIAGESFISCDNPVIIRNPTGNSIDYFDPTNIFHIPISPEYSITITPSTETTLKRTFTRYSYSKEAVLCTNHDINKCHEQFLFGAQDDIERFESDLKLYDDPSSPEGQKMFAEQTRLAEIMISLQDAINNYGIYSEEYKNLMEKYWKEESVVRRDDNFANHMKELGLL